MPPEEKKDSDKLILLKCIKISWQAQILPDLL